MIKIMNSSLYLITFLIFLVSNEVFVLASYGDRDHLFQGCVKKCVQVTSSTSVPLLLQIFMWDHKSDCQYHCMFNITQQRVESGEEVLQYYGKWPFTRILGMEEPASVLFCVLHCFAQFYGWSNYQKQVSKRYKFYYLTKIQFLLNIFAWICATLFHTRDFYWTEKMDYFSATLVVGLFIFVFFTRVTGKLHDTKVYISGCLVSLAMIYHIYFMAFVRFDYGYNTKFMVVLALTNIVLWLSWCFYRRQDRPYVWKCAVHMVAILFLAALELWDFPPLFWILDGHALWHMSTIPLSYFWYNFLLDEYLFEMRYNLP